MIAPKWSDDAFLDTLRRQTDPLADRAVERLVAEGGVGAANHVFQHMHADGEPMPEDVPPPLAEFLDATAELPPGIDRERLDCAGELFLEHGLTAAVVLLASSLPRGYQAPCLCEILMISKNLRQHPFRRLMGVVQLLVNIARPGAFRPGGLAVVTAQKLRLLHAGVRSVVPRHKPHYRETYGPPVNHEDMLATAMAFSWLVIDGLRRLGAGFEHEDHYYYLWRVFAQMMGIHPEGRPGDDTLIPATIDEARTFYESYARRRYTPGERNPDGPVLARENLAMMEHLIPAPLRRAGFGHAPQLVMTELLPDEALARLDMVPDHSHGLLERTLRIGLRGVQWAMDRAPTLSEILARHLFQGMIRIGRGGHVDFVIPDSLAALRGSGLV